MTNPRFMLPIVNKIISKYLPSDFCYCVHRLISFVCCSLYQSIRTESIQQNPDILLFKYNVVLRKGHDLILQSINVGVVIR